MNPIEQKLQSLALPTLQDNLRDRVLFESGLRQGRRVARLWQTVTVALAATLGLSWLPIRAPFNRDPSQPDVQVAVEIAQPVPEPLESKPKNIDWLAGFLAQVIAKKELEIERATRMDMLEPLLPPVWATPTKQTTRLESINILINNEDR